MVVLLFYCTSVSLFLLNKENKNLCEFCINLIVNSNLDETFSYCGSGSHLAFDKRFPLTENYIAIFAIGNKSNFFVWKQCFQCVQPYSKGSNLIHKSHLCPGTRAGSCKRRGKRIAPTWSGRFVYNIIRNFSWIRLRNHLLSSSGCVLWL